MTEDLTKKKCAPCEGGVIPFDISEIHVYQKKVDGWDILKNEKNIFHLYKKYIFKNFLDSQSFINKVAESDDVDKKRSNPKVELLKMQLERDNIRK